MLYPQNSSSHVNFTYGEGQPLIKTVSAIMGLTGIFLTEEAALNCTLRDSVLEQDPLLKTICRVASYLKSICHSNRNRFDANSLAEIIDYIDQRTLRNHLYYKQLHEWCSFLFQKSISGSAPWENILLPIRTFIKNYNGTQPPFFAVALSLYLIEAISSKINFDITTLDCSSVVHVLNSSHEGAVEDNFVYSIDCLKAQRENNRLDMTARNQEHIEGVEIIAETDAVDFALHTNNEPIYLNGGIV